MRDREPRIRFQREPDECRRPRWTWIVEQDGESIVAHIDDAEGGVRGRVPKRRRHDEDLRSGTGPDCLTSELDATRIDQDELLAPADEQTASAQLYIKTVIRHANRLDGDLHRCARVH